MTGGGVSVRRLCRYILYWPCTHQSRNLVTPAQVQKSASQYSDAARDEITLLTQIKEGDPSDAKHCVRLYDDFEHVGAHGKHVCMVFEVR